jgi:DNA-binding transcriptional LysR family regulator
MLSPVALRSLREVLTTGSFAEAAANLGYTPSAVSQQMTSLERSLRITLFERHPHCVKPTPAAHLLAASVDRLLTELERIEREMQALAAGERGAIRVGAFPTAGSRIVPDALARFVAEHPCADVYLEEGEPDQLVPSLVAGALDLAIVYRYDLVPTAWPDSLGAVALMEEDLFVLAPARRSHWDGNVLSLAELRSDTWISSDEDGAGAQCLVRLCAAEGFSPRIAFRSNDYAVVRGLVRSGLGVALVPSLGVGEGPGVRALRLSGSPPRRHVVALHRSLNTNPLLDPMLECFLGACAG